MSERRTIRRYAHEMYPHAEEGETRALGNGTPFTRQPHWPLIPAGLD